MNRRTFLTSVAGGLLAAPLAAEAQQAKDHRPRIVFLWPFRDIVRAEDPVWRALREGLAAAGYVVGRDAVFELRSTEGRSDALPTVVDRLVDEKPNVVITTGELPARALMRATTTIPIVVMAVGDPVRTGLVKSLTRPGGNLTAVVHTAPELSAKRVELLKELAPRVRRVAMLWNPANPHNALQWHATQAAAKTLGLKAHSREVRRDEDLEPAFSASQGEVDGLIVAADNLLYDLRNRIAEQALLQRLPAVGPDSSFAEAGGLASYGADFVEIWRQAGVYAEKILGGAKVAELPVQQPTKLVLVINLKTAKALGLTIPPSVLLRADQIIE